MVAYPYPQKKNVLPVSDSAFEVIMNGSLSLTNPIKVHFHLLFKSMTALTKEALI